MCDCVCVEESYILLCVCASVLRRPEIYIYIYVKWCKILSTKCTCLGRGKLNTPQICDNETCDCPARRLSAPFLDSIKAMDTIIQQTKPKDLKAQDNNSKDDSAEKENASDSESVDRFDTQNLFGAFITCIFWDG